jgi:hypothetical protein
MQSLYCTEARWDPFSSLPPISLTWKSKIPLKNPGIFIIQLISPAFGIIVLHLGDFCPPPRWDVKNLIALAIPRRILERYLVRNVRPLPAVFNRYLLVFSL